jgi:UPF0755 protein
MPFFSKLSLFKKVFWILIFFVFAFALYTGINAYRKIYMPNVIVSENHKNFICIPTGSNLEDVCRILYERNYIVNRNSFEWLAERKKYSNSIKPGRYKLKNHMSNNELIDILRAGKQERVRISFHNIRLINQVAGIVGRHLEVDSVTVLKSLNDPEFDASLGFTKNDIMAIFIPNTYEFFWNTNAQTFMKRMKREYVKFWNAERQKKSKEIGLTPVQVMSLASILTEESNTVAEYPVIAGVYINRLRRDMPLQSDPTVKFALGNFNLKRIYHRQTEFDSPYNTYLYKGLPPGPIAMPTVKAIDAVLNFQKHSYLYFCAKSDFSGSHVFAKTLTQHNQNAAAYQAALNNKKIY